MRKKKSFFLLFIVIAALTTKNVNAQNPLDSILPVRGLAIAAPPASFVDSFIMFIEKELAPRHVNTLILRVDYNYQYKSHPELQDSISLIFCRCKKNS